MRLGILGGTYDPIHLGHLLLAEQSREALHLDKVLLIPAAFPPHKPRAPVASYAERLHMVHLAVAGIPELSASDLESSPEAPSFTVETLRRLRAMQSDLDELWLLLGSDSLLELPGWREPAEIQRLARVAVYPRPGWPPETPRPEGEGSRGPQAPAQGPAVTPLDGPRLRLSSTEIRRRVREGRSIRFLVPEAVRRFIAENGLYTTDPESCTGPPQGGAQA